MDAIVICVGDELLTGDIQDLNSTWLARQLFDLGVDLKRITVIPDVPDVIAAELTDARADVVIVTGGLGPTHDDVTRQGVARAAGVPLARSEEARKVVEARCRNPAPAAYVMADIPEGAEVVPNPAGAAPGFVVDGRIFVFPGVPSELKAMFPLVAGRFKGDKMVVEWLITKRKESDIVAPLNEAVGLFPQVSFGSYPSDVVKIKMKSRDREAVMQAKDWLAARILD
ncbi:MAG: competence damage-inducible protein A [Methanocella sp. PtaU1.Bin125]|nr:MAG: competence damage-inducible protein A [Methanocella sp. PtaU1.Bin125]